MAALEDMQMRAIISMQQNEQSSEWGKEKKETVEIIH